MRTFVMIIAMAVTTLAAHAQTEKGRVSLKPLVGLNIADVTKGEGESKVGLAMGAEVEYMINGTAALSVGAIYSAQGAKLTKEGDDFKLNLDYINIPILANFYLAKGFALKTGLQPAIKVKSKAKLGSISMDVDGIKSLDFAIPIGLSFQISQVVIDARYNIGMSKLADDVESKNSVFQFTLGYKFAL